jgi:hypothetical protein
LSSSFANLLEAVFCGFGENPRMPSNFSKLLELLMLWTFSFTGFRENLMLVILKNESSSFMSVDLFESAHWYLFP